MESLGDPLLVWLTKADWYVVDEMRKEVDGDLDAYQGVEEMMRGLGGNTRTK